MVENKSTLFGIIAIIIGASGLGLGAFSVVNFQLIEGPEGPQGGPGDDGQDGIDGIEGVDGIDGIDFPGGIVIGILDPDDRENVSGNVTIRALVAGSKNYTVSVLRNGTEIGTTVPMDWDTSLEFDNWYNITIIVTDIETSNVSSDNVVVYVLNTPRIIPHVTAYRGISTQTIPSGLSVVDFNVELNDTTNSFNSPNFTVPEDGFYFITSALRFGSLTPGEWIGITININGSGYFFMYDFADDTHQSLQITSIIWLSTEDVISVSAYTDDAGGAIINLSAGYPDDIRTFITIYKIDN